MRSAAARAAAGSVAAGGGWLAGTSNACPSLSCDGARLVDVVMMSQYKKSSRLLPELFKQKKLTVQTRDCWTTGMQPAAAFYAGGPPGNGEGVSGVWRGMRENTNTRAVSVFVAKLRLGGCNHHTFMIPLCLCNYYTYH